MNWQQHLILFLALSLALVGATLATWPVVTDAPWEKERIASPATGDERRCVAALTLRERAIFDTESALNRAGRLHFLEQAVAEIGRYC